MANEVDINFEDFETLPVVKKLRQIVGNWWSIQLNFTDEKGYLRGVPQGKFFNPKNPVCKYITENNDTFRDCISIARQTTIESQDSQGYVLSTCHAGFSTMSMPLRVENKYIGCIFADGFLIEETVDEQKERLKIYLEKSYKSDVTKSLEDFISSLPILSLKDIGYLKELLEVVLDEILLLRKTIVDDNAKFYSLSSSLKSRWNFENIVGKSVAMQNVFNLLSKISDSEATILITGENGTGKEGIAKAIHINSKRKNQVFIVQNCGALNDNLLESELFGHVKGAFTNALKDKKGLFELADKGTLFLDEIGDTSPAMQVKLLRILQEGTFTQVGGMEQKKVDVRILVATNKNLEQMVKEGTFREDLYYRLNVINVKLPPLRDRKDDIPLLINKFLDDYSETNHSTLKKINSSCLYKMEKYDWPGNVRELQNEVERLCVLSGGDIDIKAELLSERIYGKQEKDDAYKLKATRLDGKLKDAIEELERNMIAHFLEIEKGNKSQVAKKLGISRASLIMKCEKYNLGNYYQSRNSKKNSTPPLEKIS